MPATRSHRREEQQWQLALAYLKRADDAANLLRIVLFVAASGFIGIVVSVDCCRAPAASCSLAICAAVVLCALSVLCLVRSWQLQKDKALERFKYLRGARLRRLSAIRFRGRADRRPATPRLDWLAFFCLLVGARRRARAARYLVSLRRADPCLRSASSPASTSKTAAWSRASISSICATPAIRWKRRSPMTRRAPTSFAFSTSPPATKTAAPFSTWCAARRKPASCR